MNHTPVLPESLPVNLEGLKPSVSLKRLNPATGVPFRQGDLRADKCRFGGYGSIAAKRTGLLYERWLSPEVFEKIAARKAKYCAANVETIAAQRAAYRAANVAKIAARNAKYRAANVETIAAYQAEYYKLNVETIAAHNAEYKKANPEKNAGHRAKYAKANPGKVNAITARRRAAKLLRTPPWLTKEQRAEIEAIYVLCAERTRVTGIPHAVDHILPLQGRTVSGLHIAANLQIITASENCSKGNRVQE